MELVCVPPARHRDTRFGLCFGIILSDYPLLLYTLRVRIQTAKCLLFQRHLLFVSLHLYNDIRLVAPTSPIRTVPAVTLKAPAIRVRLSEPVPPAGPPLRRPSRSGSIPRRA